MKKVIEKHIENDSRCTTLRPRKESPQGQMMWVFVCKRIDPTVPTNAIGDSRMQCLPVQRPLYKIAGHIAYNAG